MIRYLIFVSFQLSAFAAFSQLDLTKSDSLLYHLPDNIEPAADDIAPITNDSIFVCGPPSPPATKSCMNIILNTEKNECLNSEINQLIKNEIRIPQKLRGHEFNATTLVSFTVMENAEVSKIEVVRSSSYQLPKPQQSLAHLLDDEAVRVVSKLRFVQPAMFSGRPVQMKFTVPIRYSNPGK